MEGDTLKLNPSAEKNVLEKTQAYKHCHQKCSLHNSICSSNKFFCLAIAMIGGRAGHGRRLGGRREREGKVGIRV